MSPLVGVRHCEYKKLGQGTQQDYCQTCYEGLPDEIKAELKPQAGVTVASGEPTSVAETLAKEGCSEVGPLHQMLQADAPVVDPWVTLEADPMWTAVGAQWVKGIGGLSLQQAAQDWTQGPKELINRLMAETISVKACAELAGVTEWVDAPDARFETLCAEAFSTSSFTQKSAVRVLANVIAYLWYNGKQHLMVSTTSALLTAAISAVESIAELDELKVCAPDQPFCLVKKMLCRIGSQTNQKLKVESVDVKDLVVALLQASQQHAGLQWLTELCTQALWQILLPEDETSEEAVSPEEAELLKLPEQLRRTGTYKQTQTDEGRATDRYTDKTDKRSTR